MHLYIVSPYLTHSTLASTYTATDTYDYHKEVEICIYIQYAHLIYTSTMRKSHYTHTVYLHTQQTLHARLDPMKRKTEAISDIVAAFIIPRNVPPICNSPHKNMHSLYAFV